jgi:hypothetical protein
MTKRREVDRGKVTDIDQVLLELLAGQLLLERAKLPGDPPPHPTSGRSPRKAKAGQKDKNKAG